MLGINESDVCFSVAKLFFAYGLGNALTFPMAAGATTRADGRAADAGRRCGPAAQAYRPTMFYGVPTFYAAFLASPDAAAAHGAEAAPLRLGRRGVADRSRPALVERYGVDILDGIGSTEMLHIFLSNRPGDVQYGTTGKPVPGYDFKLVDEEVRRSSAGEMGELLVRGPTSAVMYWNNREQSRSTFLGEWTRSGDKYIEDEKGYFVYCGRTRRHAEGRACTCRPSRSRRRWPPIRTCWRPRWWAGPMPTG